MHRSTLSFGTPASELRHPSTGAQAHKRRPTSHRPRAKGHWAAAASPQAAHLHPPLAPCEWYQATGSGHTLGVREALRRDRDALSPSLRRRLTWQQALCLAPLVDLPRLKQ